VKAERGEIYLFDAVCVRPDNRGECFPSHSSKDKTESANLACLSDLDRRKVGVCSVFDRIDPDLLPFIDSEARVLLQGGQLSVDDHQALLDEAKRKHDFVEASIPEPSLDDLRQIAHADILPRFHVLSVQVDLRREWYERHRAETIRRGNETGWRDLPLAPATPKREPPEQPQQPRHEPTIEELRPYMRHERAAFDDPKTQPSVKSQIRQAARRAWVKAHYQPPPLPDHPEIPVLGWGDPRSEDPKSPSRPSQAPPERFIEFRENAQAKTEMHLHPPPESAEERALRKREELLKREERLQSRRDSERLRRELEEFGARAGFPPVVSRSEQPAPPQPSMVDRPWHKHRELVVGLVVACVTMAGAILLWLIAPRNPLIVLAGLVALFGFLAFSAGLVGHYYGRLRLGVVAGILIAFLTSALGWSVWPKPLSSEKEASLPRPSESASPPPTEFSSEAKPNIVPVGYGERQLNFNPLTQTFVMADTGLRAVVAEFRNAHESGREISEAKDIRAHVSFEPFDFYKKLDKTVPGFANVEEGIWLNEKNAVVNFTRGETKTLILVVQMQDGGFGGFDAFEHSTSRTPDGRELFLPRMPKLSADKYVVKVEITGGAKGEIAELYHFTITLRPKLKIVYG
jgi:hypothetical protein